MNLDRHNLIGGLQISIDMEKTFDSISRTIVIRALDTLNLRPQLLNILHA